MDKMKLFWEEVQKARSDPDLKHLREGQIFWGVLQKVDDSLGGRLTGEDVDPFHDDSRINAFVAYLTKEWGA
jgi:hypothetical protein